MVTFLQELQEIDTLEDSLEVLNATATITPSIQKAIDFSIQAHQGQTRKSGIPYVIHPICVASIVAFYGGDEAMICASLLHDVVEDTHFSLQEVRDGFGDEVAEIVDALTKIVELRDENIPSGISDAKILASALSFRKVLLASIQDVRAIFVKICDRLHNMLTLDALDEKKQIKISEETLVVYAPIAYRLGIASIKNELEDRSFYYIFKEEYHKIQTLLKENALVFNGKLAEFVEKLQTLLFEIGLTQEDFEIQSRLKRPYSIYLKMQRKGVGIEEILDLLAVRVILKEKIDCYKVLGAIHLQFKPIISRFKDYIAIPKENGYQTIHTTIFDASSIFEVQIRTQEMQKSAEYGLAAHWKYKMGNQISLDWLNIEYKDQNIGEFYELIKSDLYREDIAVFSPRGDIYSLPSGSVALDFAYAVHTELGDNAVEAYINHQKSSLLERLNSGDIVRIITGERNGMRCSWIPLVQTAKAKNKIRISCQNKLKAVENKITIQILATLFNQKHAKIEQMLQQHNINNLLHLNITQFKEAVVKLLTSMRRKSSLFARLRFLNWAIKEYLFDNIKILSHKYVDGILHDYCCYPKQGDEILGILDNQKVIIHHKLCEKVKITETTKMLYVTWAEQNKAKYKIIAMLEDRRGSLAKFLLDLAKYDCNLLNISYKGYKDQLLVHFEIIVEIENKEVKELKNFVLHRYNIVEFQNIKDAYQ
ncbi:penta-phosphate guanosine-3'-pyrophosphohydrolase [Helicobacter enhydrae]|uniref:Penta-phosphate guanosine-3'-pyrophosphohydrolase n=1 Tax=Helicobacter enhydrae TaxID=222136 RepID=A0A1B1U513_9HELI|nr:RelA/SpoT family protein [Helicobacter enhydrae]ANV97853.1 penta-phosphate guanosine-3'-pyrophosphohydrolase [Helicobacter enhydrae]